MYTQNTSRLTVWGDRTEHSAALAPGEEDRIGVHLMLLVAQLHDAGSSWATAFPAVGGCLTAGVASDRPSAALHG